MIRICWTEIRRSPLRWWLPLLVAIDLATLFGRQRYWIGVWPQASAAAQIVTMFLAPALAGAAAWAAATRSRQPGTADRFNSSLRPQWQLEFAQLAGSLCYGLLAYGIGIVAATLVSLPEAGPGFLWPGYLLLGLSVLVAATAIGHMTGRLTRSRVLAPTLAATVVLGIMVMLNSIASLELVVLSGPPQKTVSAAAISARLAFAGVLTVAAVVLPALVDRRVASWRPLRGTAAVAGLTATGLLGTTAIWIVAGPLTVPRPPLSTPLCSQGTSTICVWPEDRKYLPVLSAMTDRLSSLPSDLFTVPTTFFEQGLRPGTEPGVFNSDDFFIIEGSPWSVSATLASDVYNASFADLCLPDDYRNKAYAKIFKASDEISYWLESRAVGPGTPPDFEDSGFGVDVNEVYAMVKAPEAEQLAWVKERVKILRNAPC